MNEQEPPPVIHEPAPSERGGRGAMWKIILTINLISGCFLWFIFLTNNSLPDEIPNYIHPFVSGGIAFISLLLLLKKNRPQGWMKRCYILSCLPSLLGCGLACLALPMIFYCVTTDQRRVLQCAVSPDHSHVAVAYAVFNPGPACASGSSETSIHVHHRFLPFIERRVCFNVGSGPPDTKEYIRWKDDDTLLVAKNKVVEVPGKYWMANGKKIPRTEIRYEFVEMKIPPIEWRWSSK